MSKIPFNVDSSTARIIGRENISGLRGALFELIKNSYDADARVCFLYYEDNALYIGDNGTGMSQQIITNNWMTIGRSTKKEIFRSEEGRIQTGAKGIGRFALDRLGEKSKMLTRNFSDSKYTNTIWEVNWEDFEKQANITEVKADLYETEVNFNEFVEECKNSNLVEFVSDNFNNTGTIFRINNLREDWEKDNFLTSVTEQLSSLLPSNLEEIFEVYFFYNNISTEDAKIVSPSVNDFDYRIKFEVVSPEDIKKLKDDKVKDEEEKEVTISIFRDEFDFGDKFKTITRDAGFTAEDIEYFSGKPIVLKLNFSDMFETRKAISNSIGSFNGNIYFSKTRAYDKDKEKYYYKTRKYERKQAAFSGLKIFRDKFRVRPYGERGTSSYDWLMLSSRKQTSPAAPSHASGNWRVNSDQVSGSVFISRLNIHLPDTSNREGIIETDEFLLFKEFLIKVISRLEMDRQYVFRKLSNYYDEVNQAAKIEKEIKEKAEKEKDRASKTTSDKKGSPQSSDTTFEEETVKASDAQIVIAQKESVIRSLEDENKMLRALATTGIVTNTYIHEIKGITHDLSMDVVDAYESLDLDQDSKGAKKSLLEAINHKDNLTSWFEITLDSVKKDKRNWKKNNLHKLLQALVERWEKVLGNKEIKIEFSSLDEEINFYCHSFEIESICNNLLTNSVSAFNLQDNDKKSIKLVLSSDENSIYIQYSDNGPGLPANSLKKNPKEILRAFTSEKKDTNGEEIGTGMGMWIIDNTIKDYRGTISLEKNKERQVGFYIDITLPKGARK